MSSPDKPVPSFDAFYSELNDRAPFPWQSRLARQVAETGEWPVEIGVPTGLGKTACLDIAVWAMAVDAIRPPAQRRAPTRIWWVVNRRLLVDATTDHATTLMHRLTEALDPATPEPPPATAAVAGLLAARSASGRPLEVHRLRGGAATGRPSDPSQPTIVLSTVPMYGSRVLFSGYGSSRSMRPIDAALAGTDSLVLVDEAHLAHHLIDLIPAASECDRFTTHPLPPDRRLPRVVSLTATGTTSAANRFDLDADDAGHPVVARRLAASKPTRIERIGSSVAKGLAAEVVAEIGLDNGPSSPTTCVVFTNTPAVAREVHTSLVKLTGGRRPALDADIELLTGRIREREAGRVRSRLLEAAGTGQPAPTERHLVVVATQTLEVGADLDFEVLITEACGVRALTQRLGRLNRIGTKARARAVYCHTDAKGGAWPVYGEEPAAVIERLDAATAGSDSQLVDLSPSQVASVLGPPGDALESAPALLPALLWEWAKTTVPPAGAAPVEPYFSGLEPPGLTVSVAWRCFIPTSGAPIWPPLRDDETVEVPLSEARQVLGDDVAVLGRDRLTVTVAPAGRLGPGDAVVLPADGGRYDRYGWRPDHTDADVCDISILRSGIPVEHDALRRLLGSAAPSATSIDAALHPSDEADPDDIDRARTELVAAITTAEPLAIPPEEWAGLLADLDDQVTTPVGEISRIARRHQPQVIVASDDLDELSLAAQIDLASHGRQVGATAGAIARRLGLPDDLAVAVEQAGTFHDIGKADQRFQRWLDPTGEASEPVAKSDRPRNRWQADRIASGWPQGGRHEELSRRLVATWIADTDPPHADLVQHLVVSHHGHGRPLIIPADDTGGGEVEYPVAGATFTAPSDLGTVDWDQPGRFRALTDTHGHWGLALLEAIVRQADHQVSAGSAHLVEVL